MTKIAQQLTDLETSSFMNVTITTAESRQARRIAQLIMLAMDHACCQYFAGEKHTLTDFEDAMTRLVEAEESQYSYRNTLVAMTADGQLAGICVTYDGNELNRLRQAFIQEALRSFGRDFSGMDDETQAGELYVDSLAVDSRYRCRGIASALLRASIERARKFHFPAVGLLVDKGNPAAEYLYTRVGFEFINDTSWGGHPMKHLQYTIK